MRLHKRGDEHVPEIDASWRSYRCGVCNGNGCRGLRHDAERACGVGRLCGRGRRRGSWIGDGQRGARRRDRWYRRRGCWRADHASTSASASAMRALVALLRTVRRLALGSASAMRALVVLRTLRRVAHGFGSAMRALVLLLRTLRRVALNRSGVNATRRVERFLALYSRPYTGNGMLSPSSSKPAYKLALKKFCPDGRLQSSVH